MFLVRVKIKKRRNFESVVIENVTFFFFFFFFWEIRFIFIDFTTAHARQKFWLEIFTGI